MTFGIMNALSCMIYSNRRIKPYPEFKSKPAKQSGLGRRKAFHTPNTYISSHGCQVHPHSTFTFPALIYPIPVFRPMLLPSFQTYWVWESIFTRSCCEVVTNWQIKTPQSWLCSKRQCAERPTQLQMSCDRSVYCFMLIFYGQHNLFLYSAYNPALYSS